MSEHSLKEEVLKLVQKGESSLDEITTLRGASKEILDLRPKAAEIGVQFARSYWDIEKSIDENINSLGISCVKWMSPVEEQAYKARAIYDPETAQILINRSRLEEMENVQKVLTLELFTKDEIYKRLVAHECFHHIEERLAVRVDEKLGVADKGSALLREVGAHAFSNEIYKTPPSQTIDLLWLAIHKPGQLNLNLS